MVEEIGREGNSDVPRAWNNGTVNPSIFFTNAVNQIQAYENLADVVIQALRYATNMGFDILVFIILDALANPQKDRVKEDGVYASDWLQSAFLSSIFEYFSSRRLNIHEK